MVASSTTFTAMPSRINLFGELAFVNVQNRTLVATQSLPQWPARQGEFDMLEPACQSDGELWSQLGCWDM